MVESMRAVGYDPRTALADLIDNSITAGARNIAVRFYWDAQASWIAVVDDGGGMDPQGLWEAMQLGSRSPLEPREATDLGRFGLGLKTASFAQCRQVSVRTRPSAGVESTAAWDLDLVQKYNDWLLMTAAPDETADRILTELLPMEGGTVVLWRKLDRLISFPDHPIAHEAFLSQMAAAETHLAMVFHRFLTGRSAISLTVNSRPIEPWDPFLAGRSQALPEEIHGSGHQMVTVQPYILPHESKLSAEEHTAGAGPKGWNAQQGFYVYRNQRLLVAGDWLRMFQQEEHYKLARIAVRIGNGLDEEWQIDIRKATAHPPPHIREQLRRIAGATRREAKRVYGHRASPNGPAAAPDAAPVWLERLDRDRRAYYRLNRRHPMIAGLLANQAPSQTEIAGALRMAEETVPINAITARYAASELSQAAPFADREGELLDLMLDFAGRLHSLGMSHSEIRHTLGKLDPFTHHPALIEALPLGDLRGPNASD